MNNWGPPQFSTPWTNRGSFIGAGWQSWFSQLWNIVTALVLGRRLPVELTANALVVSADANKLFFCSGGDYTHTLPVAANAQGLSFFFINRDAGITTTIAGMINGAADYVLTAQYEYVQVTSDGAEYFVTNKS